MTTTVEKKPSKAQVELIRMAYRRDEQSDLYGRISMYGTQQRTIDMMLALGLIEQQYVLGEAERAVRARNILACVEEAAAECTPARWDVAFRALDKAAHFKREMNEKCYRVTVKGREVAGV